MSTAIPQIKALDPIHKAVADDSRNRDFVYRMSFDQVLPAGVVITSATVSATTGLDSGNAAPSTADVVHQGSKFPLGRTVEFDLWGGTAGATYVVSVTATLTAGSILAGLVDVVVE